MHREWWINNRINYFNGKYLSDAYKSDKYVMRLYTPQNGAAYFIPQYDLSAEDFQLNIEEGIQYYIKDENDEYVRIPEDATFDASELYYVE
jgi:hypothetical protein